MIRKYEDSYKCIVKHPNSISNGSTELHLDKLYMIIEIIQQFTDKFRNILHTKQPKPCIHFEKNFYLKYQHLRKYK